MGDNFLSQGIDSCSRGNATVDLMVTKVSELIGGAKTGGSGSTPMQWSCFGGICNLEEYRSAKE